MSRLLLGVMLAMTAALVGCTSDVGHVKGRIVENGEPLAVEGQVALMLYRIDDKGQPNEAQSYPIPLEKDGTFELVASGGAVPPGTYLVSLVVAGKKTDKGIARYKNSFPYPGSKLRQEVKPGENEVTIDLAAGKASPSE